MMMTIIVVIMIVIVVIMMMTMIVVIMTIIDLAFFWAYLRNPFENQNKGKQCEQCQCNSTT